MNIKFNQNMPLFENVQLLPFRRLFKLACFQEIKNQLTGIKAFQATASKILKKKCEKWFAW